MNVHRPIQFCCMCGAPVTYRVPDGDTHPRAVCTRCGHIQYENPLLVAGTVPVFGDGRILLCRRNIEPRRGRWTLPAGFMELGETTAEAAQRETDEEAGAHITLGPLFTLLNVKRVAQVHLYYLAELLDAQFAPGPESMEARLFAEAGIPWEQIAFTTVRITLQHYFADRKRHALPRLHIEDVD